MTLPLESLAALREALAGERDVVRAWWDEGGRRLTVALREAGTRADDYRDTVQRIAQLVLPLVAGATSPASSPGAAGVSLVCGPEDGVTPGARGRTVYVREPGSG
ncbi:MAG TPA: hypothetical protein VFJ77_08675 [Gaiellaceae bacterium]|nr:hypothetical protein [Gaiellaceae bacterium]